MNIILISGFSTSGKDVLGSIFCDKHGFTRFAFADSLKEIVSKKYGCAVDLLHTHEGKNSICPATDTTWRAVLIKESLLYKETEPDIFARICAENIEKYSKTSHKLPYYVVTDWRFPNEFDTIRRIFPDACIVPVRITCDSHNGISPVNDSSEYALQNMSRRNMLNITLQNSIFNDKIIDALNIFADDIITNIRL